MRVRGSDKINVCLYIDKSLYQRAKKLGIPLSQFFEIKLREEIVLIENGLRSVKWCPDPDLNRGPRGLQPRALPG